MVRKYKRKTGRATADAGVMQRAVKEVEKGRSIRQVARDLQINRITLSRYVSKFRTGQTSNTSDFAPIYNSRQIFTFAEEDGLQEYILRCSVMFHGLTYVDTRRLSYEYALKKGKTIPASWRENCMAGRDWMYYFMKRHSQISLRSPEATSMARAQGFNRRSVGDFFELWKETQAEKKYGPEFVYNLDESGITTVQNIPKVLAAKGMKQVGQITASERGTLVTICCCVNAVGKALPPVMVSPMVHFKEHMIKGAPNGTLGLATKSGWMNSELFPLVLKHFIKHIGCSQETPAVLFMDNHESHLGLEVIDIARSNRLTIITFPPHTSHKLQPLDVAVYGPLKTYYKRAINDWNLTHPGARVTIYDLPECFTIAFHTALTFENISAGFRKTGIWPLNTSVFSEDDFAAVSVFVNETQADASLENDKGMQAVEHPESSSSAAETSFDELALIRPLPKRKAIENSSMTRSKRKIVGCKILTSTPEKQQAEQNIKKKPSKNTSPSSSSSEEAGTSSDSPISDSEDDTFDLVDEITDDPIRVLSFGC